jgi:hypothetical protein
MLQSSKKVNKTVPALRLSSMRMASIIALAGLLLKAGVSGRAQAAPEQAQEPAIKPCLPDDVERPIHSTIEASVQFTMDSAHLKPGKGVWVKTTSEFAMPGCSLNQDAVIYGHIVAASSKKTSDTAELALVFDHADCHGHDKQGIALHLIGIVVVGDPENLHSVLPAEVAGGTRQISNTPAGQDGYDPKLAESITPSIIHPGFVAGDAQLQLQPTSGPECSARIVTGRRSVQLGRGVELILAPYETIAPKR